MTIDNLLEEKKTELEVLAEKAACSTDTTPYDRQAFDGIINRYEPSYFRHSLAKHYRESVKKYKAYNGRRDQ